MYHEYGQGKPREVPNGTAGYFQHGTGGGGSGADPVDKGGERDVAHHRKLKPVSWGATFLGEGVVRDKMLTLILGVRLRAFPSGPLPNEQNVTQTRGC